jgi:hypothetical protein
VRVYQESSTSIDDSNNQVQTPIFYPNPVEDVLTIELEELVAEDVVFNVYDVAGKLVNSQMISVENTRVDLNGFRAFDSGMYFISYELNGRKYGFKVFKK